MLGESVEKKKSFKQEDVQQKLLEGGAAICYDRFGWLGSKESKEEHIDQTTKRIKTNLLERKHNIVPNICLNGFLNVHS